MATTLQLNPQSPKGHLADFRHASKLFVADTFRLAPKTLFNYYVKFSINKTTKFNNKYENDINLMVKKCELPKIELKNTVVNQYNRRKIVQLGVDYKPITITLHDDREGVSRHLWETYFKYYYADSKTAEKDPLTYIRNPYIPGYIQNAFPYGLDSEGISLGGGLSLSSFTGSMISFFEHITIFHMANHKYVGYRLINPVILSWNHPSLDYANGATPAENTLTIGYEAISYSEDKLSGDVTGGTPFGFASNHYDNIPSPLVTAPPPPSGPYPPGSEPPMSANMQLDYSGPGVGRQGTEITSPSLSMQQATEENYMRSNVDVISNVPTLRSRINNNEVYGSALSNMTFPLSTFDGGLSEALSSTLSKL